MKQGLTKNIKYIIGLCIASILYLLMASYTTSILLPNVNSGDSAIFQLMGKDWVNGLLPYVKLFDHKGPFIFFVNSLGYLFGGRVGIFIIQIISLTITLLGFWKCFRLKMSDNKSFFASLSLLLILSMYYSGGNLTEEYSLPFLSWSLYFILSYWLKRNIHPEIIEHPAKYAFLYGISFSVIFMMRATNTLLISTYIFAILISLVYHKKWANIGKNALGFIVGFLVIFGPFSIYFLIHHAFYDMIYATFLFNLKYAKGATLHLSQMAIGNKIYILECFLPIILLLLTSVWYLRKRRDWFGFSSIVLSILTLYLFMNSNFFGHYYMIILPYISIIIILLAEMNGLGFPVKNANKKNILFSLKYKKFSLFILLLLVCVLLISTKKTAGLAKHFALLYRSTGQYQMYNKEANELSKKIDDKESVVGYNLSSRWYLATDINPCYHYYTLQDWQSTFDKNLKHSVTDYFTSGDAKYILVQGKIKNNKVADYMEKNYQKIGEMTDTSPSKDGNIFLYEKQKK